MSVSVDFAFMLTMGVFVIVCTGWIIYEWRRDAKKFRRGLPKPDKACQRDHYREFRGKA